MNDENLGFANVDINKLPRHKYNHKDMSRYADLIISKSDEEFSKEELEFVLDMEKATADFFVKAYDYTEEEAQKYVLNNRQRIREINRKTF